MRSASSMAAACLVTPGGDQIKRPQNPLPKRCRLNPRRAGGAFQMQGKMLRAILAMLVLAANSATAQPYDPGASGTEIKLGQTMPYSGPVSVAGAVGHASLAYFAAANKAGGINGRQVKLLSLDDSYSPPKTVEMTRRLVGDDQVLLLYASVGTPANVAVERYLNLKKVPQIF